MEDFLKYIEAKNAEIEARASTENYTFYSLYPTSKEYWIGRGVTTIAKFERDEDECTLYEICKDRGWRRGDISSLSNEELKEEIEYHSKKLSEEIDQERKTQNDNVEKFEVRVNEMIELGAADREAAIKWICDAEGIGEDQIKFYGMEVLEHELNIPYGYLSGKEA